VIFLVDAKLVLLQSSNNEAAARKYDMRVIAHNVEYFDLMRDQGPLSGTPSPSLPQSPAVEGAMAFHNDRGLRDSLWYFDGGDMHCWMDVNDLLQTPSTENSREIPPTVAISSDFYPTSIILRKGILLGLDADLVQRRDAYFAFFRFSIRTQLFLPPILHRHLLKLDTLAASSLAHSYQQFPYFPHALEILLHTVLDEEVDRPPEPDAALLPRVISFLSSFPDYLDILVQCTRKTEIRSWRTLFDHLPPPQELFEASLEKGILKTAGGYLLVLSAFEDTESSSAACVKLLRVAKEAGDWDLCKELARFLMALDQTGDTLKDAMGKMNLEIPANESEKVRLQTPRPNAERRSHQSPQRNNGMASPISSDTASFKSPLSDGGSADYFSQPNR